MNFVVLAGESRDAKHDAAMKKPFTLLISAACCEG
jgi:hypothetical protein